jgi:hypothetical protein
MVSQAEKPVTGMTESLSIAPDAERWRSLLGAWKPSDEAAAFRRELGLPTDRPVVMTGHQAQLWHPGILAKYLAADAFARSMSPGGGAATAWLLVDQDVNAPAAVRVPVRAASGDGAADARALRVEVWAADGGGAGGGEDVPTGRRPAFRPAALPVLEPGERYAAAGVGPGLARIRAALERHAGAGSAAAQVGAAVGELLEPLLPGRGITVPSLALSRTALFAGVVERLRRDPAACTRAYNAAVAAHPRERVGLLKDDELPLWAMGQELGAVRRRVTVTSLSETPVEHLAPRALLMTGLFRMAGCDLFIHGTGGGGAGGHDGYDRITEAWLGEWLGSTLAPSAVVTATLRLRIAHAGPDAGELRRRRWAWHRAIHDPALLGDGAAAARKREFVERIRREREAEGGGDPRAEYKRMHAFLEEVRAEHAAGLDELRAAAAGAAAGLGDAEIAAERAWAFPLYEDDQLEGLRAACAGAFGVE